MDENSIPADEIDSTARTAARRFVQGQPARAEQVLRERIGKAASDVERYFACLHYAELLSKVGRLEEARHVLIQSARIAVSLRNGTWLAHSHEKLGDLSAAEPNLFGALHHYRYALRTAAAFVEHPALEPLEAKARSTRERLHAEVLSLDPTIVPLGTEYVFGNLAVSFVHRDIFRRTYFAHCLQCDFCHDWCCSFGADVDVENVERIQQHRQGILPFIRPSRVDWFEPGDTYFEEYAGNRYTRINPQGPRCVFISRDQRGCGLHRYALSKGMDYHELKPLVCILFPLSFGEGILCIAPELEDDSLVCGGSGLSVYRSMRGELEHYFGRELLEELDGIEEDRSSG